MTVLLRELLVTQDFKNRLSCLNDKVKDEFRFWQAHSPHFTDHGETHCEAIEKNLDELIPEQVKSEINEYESFLLLSGVLLHDVGIMCSTKTDEENKIIRKNHHIRSRDYVLNNLKDLLNLSERFVVGEICYAHRDCVPIKKIEKTKTIRHVSLGNQEIRVQFLAALIRLADTFELCHTRTSENLIEMAKIPADAAFYHALHERLSGINFDSDEHCICLDFNISSQQEKTTCFKYVVHDAQHALNTVRDILVSNGIVYTTVNSKFSITNAIQSKLQVPKKSKSEFETQSAKQTYTELEMIKTLAWQHHSNQKYNECLELCEKGLKIAPEDSALLFLKATTDETQGNLPEACEAYEKCLNSSPKDLMYLTMAGHFYGETLLEMRKSCDCFERAYNFRPDDDALLLNYAEALVTVGKHEEAYNLTIKYWKKATEMFRATNSKFIEAYSLIFMGKESEGLKELSNLFFLLRGCPPREGQRVWVYKKISKYICDSNINTNNKNVLIDTIQLFEKSISYKDYATKWNISKSCDFCERSTG